MVVVVGALGGCGVPQPFRHNAYAPNGNPLVTLREGAGVSVLPLGGAPSPMDRMIADDLAAWLRERDVPAVAVVNATPETAGLRLVGWLGEVVQDPDPGPDGVATVRLTVQWTLLASDGTVIEGANRTTRVQGLQWVEQDPSVAERIARDQGRAVAGMVVVDQRIAVGGVRLPDRPLGPSLIQPPRGVQGVMGAAAPASDQTQDPSLATVAPDAASAAPAQAVSALVMAPPEVTRAPGDGKQALERALTRLFKLNGVRVLDEVSDKSLRVRGAVEVVPAEDSRQEHVSIVWEVLDAAGESLGQVNQNNTIPKGLLDGAWGETAALIAEGAAMGVGEVLVQKGLVAPPGR